MRVILFNTNRYYSNLNCDLKSLPGDSDDFGLVEQYIMSTHAATHNHYTMDVVQVFQVNTKIADPLQSSKCLNYFDPSQCAKKTKFNEKMKNRKLLFHGSRMSNWCGILSQGLRIAPPEAPVTGYMFGKGIYFADMSRYVKGKK